MRSARVHALLTLGVLMAAAWLLRAPFLAREIWGLDEGSTFTMAEQVRGGAVLYRDAVDNRSPLMPYLKAVVFAIAGEWNIRAQHLTLALALGAAAFGLFGIASRPGGRSVGYWSAGAFTLIVFLWPGVIDALGAHTESYLILFSISGFLLLVRALPRGGAASGVAIGLAFAGSSLCKQPGVLDFAVALSLLALLAWRQPGDRRRLAMIFAGAIAGFVAAWTATCLYFAVHGAWSDFVYYGWTFNARLYVPEVPLQSRLLKVSMLWDLALAWMPFALVIGLPGLILLGAQAVRSLTKRSQPLALLPLLAVGWFLAGAMASVLSGRTFPHYLIQAAPGLSLICGWTLAHIAEWGGSAPSHRTVRTRAAWALLGAVVLWGAVDVVKLWRRLDGHDDPGDAALRSIVQRETGKAERIFVWGYYPEAYAICRRLPATRFIYTNYLTGMIPWTNLAPEIDTRYAVKPDAWAAFWRDYERTTPALILDAPIRGYAKYPLLSQPRLRDEIVDRFAELRPATARGLPVRIFKRLAATDDSLATVTPATHDDVTIELTRESGQADLVTAAVRAPVGTSEIALRLGGIVYRQMRCRPDQASEVRFMVRLRDLSAHGTVIDAVVRRNGELVAAKPVDVARRLVLDLRATPPRPVLEYSIHQLAPLAMSSADGWQPLARENREGWQHVGPFDLTFDRPPAMHRLSFSWLPPPPDIESPDGSGAAGIEVQFDSALVPSEKLPLTITAGPAGLQDVSVELPRGDPGKLILRFSTSGLVWLGAIRGAAHGPPLRFGERVIRPALAVQNDQERLTPSGDQSFDTHAFARLMYPRVPGMEAIVAEYGIRAESYQPPVGGVAANVIFEVNYLHEDGRRENLLTRGLDPVNRPDDRGVQTSAFTLPPQGLGEIEFRFVPLNRGNPADRAYVRRLRAQGAGPDLLIAPERVLVPLESETSGDYRIHVKSDSGWVAHAPGMVAYACPPDLKAITFGYGLESSAYWDENHHPRSDGIDAIVELVEPNGNITHLYQRSLDPFNRPADRGVQKVRVELPGRAGRLVIRLTPGRFSSPAFDWSYLTDIVGETDS